MPAMLLHWGLLFLSWWGYVRLTARWRAVPAGAALLCVFSAQTVLLLLAGLTGISGAMPALRLVLRWGGVAALAASFAPRLRPRGEGRAHLCLLFALLVLWGGWTLYGRTLQHADNFSHWGVIARLMLRTDRLPVAADGLRFPTYPPATACFLYYACREGAAEWELLLAQALLVFACPLAVEKALPRKSVVCGAVLAAVFALACAVFPGQLGDLLVDGLLGAWSAACLCLLCAEGRRLRAPLLGLLLGMLTLVKTSGAFLALLLLGFAASLVPKGRERLRYTALAAAGPVLLFVVWRLHVLAAFPDGMTTKHALSIANFTQIVERKTMADLLGTARTLAGRMLGQRRALALLACLLAAWIWTRRGNGGQSAAARRLPAFAIVAYVLYAAGLLAMYILSMRRSEAAQLGGFDRYHKTIELLLVGAAVLWTAAQKRGPRAAGCAALAAWCLWAGFLPGGLLPQEPDASAPRQRLETALAGERYEPLCICRTDAGYSGYADLAHWLWGPGDVRECVDPTAAELAERAAGCEALLVLDPCPGAEEFLGTAETGLFRLEGEG